MKDCFCEICKKNCMYSFYDLKCDKFFCQSCIQKKYLLYQDKNSEVFEFQCANNCKQPLKYIQRFIKKKCLGCGQKKNCNIILKDNCKLCSECSTTISCKKSKSEIQEHIDKKSIQCISCSKIMRLNQFQKQINQLSCAQCKIKYNKSKQKYFKNINQNFQIDKKSQTYKTRQQIYYKNINQSAQVNMRNKINFGKLFQKQQSSKDTYICPICDQIIENEDLICQEESNIFLHISCKKQIIQRQIIILQNNIQLKQQNIIQDQINFQNESKKINKQQQLLMNQQEKQQSLNNQQNEVLEEVESSQQRTTKFQADYKQQQQQEINGNSDTFLNDIDNKKMNKQQKQQKKKLINKVNLPKQSKSCLNQKLQVSLQMSDLKTNLNAALKNQKQQSQIQSSIPTGTVNNQNFFKNKGDKIVENDNILFKKGDKNNYQNNLKFKKQNKIEENHQTPSGSNQQQTQDISISKDPRSKHIYEETQTLSDQFLNVDLTNKNQTLEWCYICNYFMNKTDSIKKDGFIFCQTCFLNQFKLEQKSQIKIKKLKFVRVE